MPGTLPQRRRGLSPWSVMYTLIAFRGSLHFDVISLSGIPFRLASNTDLYISLSGPFLIQTLISFLNFCSFPGLYLAHFQACINADPSPSQASINAGLCPPQTFPCLVLSPFQGHTMKLRGYGTAYGSLTFSNAKCLYHSWSGITLSNAYSQTSIQGLYIQTLTILKMPLRLVKSLYKPDRISCKLTRHVMTAPYNDYF